MKKILTLTIAITLVLSGCATTGALSPFGQPSTNKPQVSAEQKTEARKGAMRAAGKSCAIGAATSVGMAIVGRFFGGGGGINAGQVAAGCVVAGAATGIQAYTSQLNDFRALQGKVTVGAVVRVDEKTVQAEGKPTKAASAMTFDLDAAKVATQHRDIQAVLSELAKTLNKQTMPITVQVRGSATDRAWLVGLLKAQLTNKQVQLNEAHGAAPVLVVSPMPVAN
jgi:hypothetical protein